jgi:hypothetical protein
MAAAGPSTRLAPRTAHRGVDQDLATGLTTYTVVRDEGTARIEAIGVDARFAKATHYTIDARDPLSARHANTMTLALGHDGWHPRIEARTVMTASAEHFLLEADLEAFDGDRRVFARSWTRAVPRKLV